MSYPPQLPSIIRPSLPRSSPLLLSDSSGTPPPPPPPPSSAVAPWAKGRGRPCHLTILILIPSSPRAALQGARQERRRGKRRLATIAAAAGVGRPRRRGRSRTAAAAGGRGRGPSSCPSYPSSAFLQ
eukprot:5046833-Pyramimonas_sp.AAC.1